MNMKTNNIIGLLGAGLLAMLTISSCDDMAEIYKGYVQDGERIYIGIADSLTIVPGNSRAQVKWKLDNDPKLKESIIKWSEKDSVIIPIESTGEQWQETTVSNLPEASLIFTAYTRDVYGNVSLKTEKTQQIYGATYISNLGARKIASVEAFSDGSVEIDWNSMDKCVGVNLYYLNKEGKETELFVPADEMVTVLSDAQLGSEFRYFTLYKPTEDCIDTFSTSVPYSMKFPAGYKLDSDGWIPTASSDAAHKGDGDAWALIDNDFNTYWHSSWDPDAPLPHWILLDMKKEYIITEISVYKRIGSTDCKTVEVYVSLDNNTYDSVGILEYAQTPTPEGLTLTLDAPVKAKYIKCVVTDSYRAPYVSLSEIKVSGTTE